MSDSAIDNSPSEAITSFADYVEAIGRFITTNPEVFGGSDIYLAEFTSSTGRAGALVGVLFGICDPDGRRAVQHYTVLAPPGVDLDLAAEEIWKASIAALEILGGREMPPDVMDWLRPRIQVLSLQDRRQSSVLELVAAATDRSAIIVLEAAQFRNPDVDWFSANGAPGPVHPEDVWAPQLHALAQEATGQIRERPVYVALDAGQSNPLRPELGKLLASIDGCGVVGMGDDESGQAILFRHLDEWTALIAEGRSGRILQNIEALPARLDSQKPFLKIQVLYRAGQLPQALEALRDELGSGREFDASSRVKLARIALDGGAVALSRSLLTSTAQDLTNLDDLESAFSTAQGGDNTELAEAFAGRLQALFPDCRTLREIRRRDLGRARDYAALVAESDDPRQKAIYRAMDRYLSVEGPPDYASLLEDAGDDLESREALRMAAVADALRRGLLPQAFDMVLEPARHARFVSARDQRLLDVLEALFLRPAGEAEIVDKEIMALAVESLVRRLAERPDDQSLRVRLVALLQPSIAGSAGLSYIALAALRLAGHPVTPEVRPLMGGGCAAWLVENKVNLAPLLAWLKDEAPIVIGRIAAPPDLRPESPDEVVSGIADYIQIAPLSDATDIQALHTWLAVGAAVAPFSSDPDFDLNLLRLAAGKMASSGFSQMARDLAEQALINCAATARRRRLGWFSMADVYLRASNHLEGLVALSCCFACSDSADEEQVFHEAIALARVLRDIGLTDDARRAITQARILLKRMKAEDNNTHRVDIIELQIRQRELQDHAPGEPAFQTLLEDAVANGRTVIAFQDRPEPVASLLAPLLRKARMAGAPVPADAADILEKLLANAGGTLVTRLRAMGAETPSPEDLLEIVSVGGATRYSDDVGFDTGAGALLAARALADDDFLGDGERTAFALELLADRGVAMPGWDGIAEPPPAPASVGEPAASARALSLEGIAVVQAGWDDEGRLIRIETVAGVMREPVREMPDQFDRGHFRAWAGTFPYQYGIDETSTNLFYTTTDNFTFSSLPDGAVVLIGDVGIQPFPPNIIRVGEAFAGRSRPMAAAPSLAWLTAARQRYPFGDGRRCAWISSATDGGQTLEMIAQRLEPSFEAHGFALDASPALPSTFSGASMAVITAHGGIHPDGQYFRVVSDEGVLRASAADLANALHNVEVVVLFVCSGGRSDKHPAANTTVGLAKQILDRGCSAVIASPWPLDSRVPGHWFPTFIKDWDDGASLIEANFAANIVVDRNFALDPARGLAMTVYGDPYLRRT